MRSSNEKPFFAGAGFTVAPSFFADDDVVLAAPTSVEAGLVDDDGFVEEEFD